MKNHPRHGHIRKKGTKGSANFWKSASYAAFSTGLFLQACEKPTPPNPDIDIVDIRPEPTFDDSQVFGREFQLTRDSQIEMVGTDVETNAPISFSRFSGKIIISKGNLTKHGHRITVDSSSLVNSDGTRPDELLGPEGFDIRSHPNFLVTLYDVSLDKNEKLTGKARVQIGNVSFQANTEPVLSWNGENLALTVTIPLPVRQQFGPDSPFSRYFGPDVKLSARLVAIPQGESESILNLGTMNLPAPHRLNRPANPAEKAEAISKNPEESGNRRSALFDSLDKNNDRRVTMKEAGNQWNSYSQADLDGDGSLSPEEFQKIRSRVIVPSTNTPTTQRKEPFPEGEPNRKRAAESKGAKTE